MNNNLCLILFTRYPQAGNTKTRLIPHLGAINAANLQRCMTEHMVKQMTALSPRIDRVVQFSGESLGQMRAWLGHHLCYQPQSAGSLGARLHQAFVEQFQAGKTRVVVIGADCPEISTAHLTTAFHQLQTHDLVLGPAADGGYYLIGLNQPQADLFEQIPWGTGQVFERTRAIAARLNLSLATLEELHDIDRPEDLARLSAIANFSLLDSIRSALA
ncbi:MAG: TIGR04282 family arsenosugar biosynthesis glycosyltransferase [Cyanobacteria bacterium P01_A01_bin.105]